jgi:hypothetical protein
MKFRALLIKGMNFSLTQRRKGKIFKGSIWKFHTLIQQRQIQKVGAQGLRPANDSSTTL